MLFGHYLASAVEPYLSMCYSRACCEEVTLRWLAATNLQIASYVIIAHELHKLYKCCQASDAAQEALLDLTCQAGLQSGQ